jgi:uncharacterized protein (TIGR02145 family)
VWVDYITVNSNNTTSGNSWTRAAISAASPTASVTYDGSNRQGFWLQGNSGSYNATVTVQLNIIASKFNWCAYVSDYPPNVTANNGTYTFKGTPPFILTASNGITSQTVTGATLAASALTITPITIRDKKEYPGVFCPYQGSDLYIDATHLCQQRTSGAQNWEAWIQDTRDNKIYRIAQLSTGLWTMDDYLNYAHPAAVDEKCSHADPNAKEYWRHTLATTYSTLCPSGWRLPSQNEYEITVTDWSQYLSKTFKTTGETYWDNEKGAAACQDACGGYITFITDACLGYAMFGNRMSSLTSSCAGQYRCQAATGPRYDYSGYVRCVR